jgi:hypothetical protein
MNAIFGISIKKIGGLVIKTNKKFFWGPNTRNHREISPPPPHYKESQ